MMPSYEQSYSLMVKVVEFYHRKQTLSGGKVPYHFHCLSVSEILKHGFDLSGQLKPEDEQYQQLILAALGHDLYEDTDVSRSYIVGRFGQEVDRLIFWMTNEKGDNDRADYIEKIKRSPELVKLIKLSDLIDNHLSVAYNIQTLGVEWVNTFFLPIVSEMKNNIILDDFSDYRQTAQILLSYLSLACERLGSNLNKYMNEHHTSEEEIMLEIEASLAERRRRLEEVKKNPPQGKEAFDFDKLAKMYDLTNNEGVLMIELAKDLEMEYYLDYENVNSLSDFAAKKEKSTEY